VLEAEKKILAEKEYRETEYLALKEDPEFLELKAMDRLNLHRPGDKVYRIKRDEE
jgi:cell division protein FtsB